MRPSWTAIAGATRSRYPSEHDYRIACDNLDAMLREALVDTFCPPSPVPMAPQPLAFCSDPTEECVRLRFALETGQGTLCTRWPAAAADVPHEATPIQIDDDVVTCDRFRLKTPKRRERPSIGRPKSDGRPPTNRVSRGVIKTWLLTNVAVAATGPSDVAAQARAYLAGDCPEDDAALLVWIRSRAKRGRPSRHHNDDERRCLIGLADIARRRK